MKLRYTNKNAPISKGSQVVFFTVGTSRSDLTAGLSTPRHFIYSVVCRKQIEGLTQSEISAAIEWSKWQEESFQVDLPERMPHEPAASPEQFETIYDLTLSVKSSALANLGYRQADFLIDGITKAQKVFTERKVHEYLDNKNKAHFMGRLVQIGVLLLGLMIIGTVFR